MTSILTIADLGTGPSHGWISKSYLVLCSESSYLLLSVNGAGFLADLPIITLLSHCWDSLYSLWEDLSNLVRIDRLLNFFVFFCYIFYFILFLHIYRAVEMKLIPHACPGLKTYLTARIYVMLADHTSNSIGSKLCHFQDIVGGIALCLPAFHVCLFGMPVPLGN